MTDSKPCIDITQNNEECSGSSDLLYCGAQFTVGDCVSLPCDGAQGDCSKINWLSSKNNKKSVEVVVNGTVKSENDTKRLRVTETCSLEVKTLREEDEGFYICRHFLSSGSPVTTAIYNLQLIRGTTTTRPTTTTVKGTTIIGRAAWPSTPHDANEIHPSTPKRTTTTVKGAAIISTAAWTSTPHDTLNASASWATAGVLLQVLVLLVFSVLTLVVLIRLIGWWRTRGDRKAEEGMDLDGAPRGPSVVQRGEQRPVGSAQFQVDHGELSDAATYENVRAPPRYVGEPPDTGVHFVTVHQLSE